jgi:16S rRNA processing protein RimM
MVVLLRLTASQSDPVPAAKTHRIVLAHVTSAHGIRGDVVLKTHMDDPHDLTRYGALSDATGGRRFEITSLRVTAKGVVVHIKGIDDRSAAEALRGAGLFIDRAALPPAEDGTYYHVDLIGLSAVDTAGAPVGKVVAVENFGAGTMLEVLRTGVRETDYVPFTDAFVPEVDIAGGRVVVVMPVMVGEPEPKDDGDELG